ncbi:MAG: Na+/H+ antiporter subunit G [Puniceicoccaceae bacterium]|nr:MAG: Na+/H+ antiporter subunit G [Puniceicoccaceae bacterium]
MSEGVTLILCLAGAVFFLAGTVGLLRFPDFFSRLHALTKADTLGLGLIVLGLMLQVGSIAAALKLLLIWVLALLASTTVCHLLGNYELSRSSGGEKRKAGS